MKKIKAFEAQQATAVEKLKPHREAFGHNIPRKDDPRFGDTFGSLSSAAGGREAKMDEHIHWIETELPRHCRSWSTTRASPRTGSS